MRSHADIHSIQLSNVYGLDRVDLEWKEAGIMRWQASVGIRTTAKHYAMDDKKCCARACGGYAAVNIGQPSTLIVYNQGLHGVERSQAVETIEKYKGNRTMCRSRDAGPRVGRGVHDSEKSLGTCFIDQCFGGAYLVGLALRR